jgi:hypothetical protein
LRIAAKPLGVVLLIKSWVAIDRLPLKGGVHP